MNYVTTMRLLEIPTELLEAVLSLLSQKDIKSLRLVSKSANAHANLRISRIFISPNHTNLAVARNIIAHPSFSSSVTEIIWDDSRFRYYEPEIPPKGRPDGDVWTIHPRRGVLFIDGPKYFEDFYEEAHGVEDEKCLNPNDTPNMYDDPEWPPLESKRVEELWGQRQRIRPKEAFEIYRKLYAEQQDIIESGEHVKVLRLALGSLPKLKRMTISSEAWRPSFLYSSYDTPFFRSLPPGFLMPSPWPWLGLNRHEGDQCDYIEEEEPKFLNSWENRPLFEDWKGYSIVVSELLAAASNLHIEEFIIDVQREMTGICYQLFNSPNPEYLNTLQLFESLHLTRLDLAINVQTAQHENFGCFRNGLLKGAFSKLKHLRQLTFRTNMHEAIVEDVSNEFWVRLEDIFPIPYAEAFPFLTHLSLANLYTYGDSVFNLLSGLPIIQNIDLDKVYLQEGSRTCESLLRDLKRVLVDGEDGAWRTRRPDLSIRQFHNDGGLSVASMKQVSDFLYSDADCPIDRNEIKLGFGWVVSGFDTDFRMPYKHQYIWDYDEVEQGDMKEAGCSW